ncbi:DUF2020 domain-containing protein [Amycolatopsis jiangsuensis]|uniref:DUF2020 domain-containing protein n=1 Tax=Amycolatopsis jiangsuensis TaxID=1181879 RepID=A0A840IX66_9PSEU|nr:DUF2020 domain-containing protein [Amycolatopsis jiangsuensis]MBB4687206.1 hypothetical protein [Amycolatopsis jiangsuensis]
MRRILLLAPALVLFAGCSPAAQVPGTPQPSPSSASSSAGLPPDPQPARTAECPYLSEAQAEDANGQHVTEVKVSDDQPHPACFFYRPDGGLQLTVRVYVGESATATALVDKAAPVDTSNPASEPAGWKGGYQPSDDGVVYAVAKGPAAVIVSSNQKQSIKARTVAKEAISALKL